MTTPKKNDFDKALEECLAAGRSDESQKKYDRRRAEEKEAAEKRKEDEARYKRELASAFNAASGLLKGLEALKNKPGSDFNYKVSENGSSVYIETNIPAENLSWHSHNAPDRENLGIGVYGDKEGNFKSLSNWIFAQCDYDSYTQYERDYWKSEEVEAHADKPVEVREVLKFIAKKAAQRGLIR